MKAAQIDHAAPPRSLSPAAGDSLRSGLLLMVILIISGVLVGTLADAQPAYGAARGILRGTVTSAENGDPIPGATVYIRELGKGISTDVDGKFRFVEIIPGLYTGTGMPGNDAIMSMTLEKSWMGTARVSPEQTWICI